ncbi:MAG: hypothetical protein JO256_06710 [Alphaproteobacteria bacterium]|nr:hypothetical protein [Alphaproteobacteria bacterium]
MDHVYMINIGRNDPLQDVEKTFILAGGALSVNQDIAGVAGKTARTVATVEIEARQTVYHIHGRGRPGGRKKLRFVGIHLILSVHGRGAAKAEYSSEYRQNCLPHSRSPVIVIGKPERTFRQDQGMRLPQYGRRKFVAPDQYR